MATKTTDTTPDPAPVHPAVRDALRGIVLLIPADPADGGPRAEVIALVDAIPTT